MGKRSAQKIETRARLLSTAKRLFTERGVAAVSMHDLASSAGLAAGTVYVHFESKAALVDALIEEVNAGLRQTLAGAMLASRATDRLGFTRDVAAAFIAYWRSHARLVDLYADHVARNASAATMRDGTNVRVPSSLGSGFQGLAEGLGLRHDATLLGHAINSLWRGVALHAITMPVESDDASAELLAEVTCVTVERLVPGVTLLELGVIQAALGAALAEHGAPPQ